MGTIISYLSGSTGRTDDPDPVTGLTSRDRYLVTSTWDIVRKNPTDNGVALLLLYFEKFPDSINLFPFADIPLKDLPTNKRFQAHCNSVIYGVSALIDKLNEPELLITILTKLGESHKPRKISAQNFWDLKLVMLEIFGTFMSKPALDAWEKTLDVAFPIAIKSLTP